MIPAGDAECCGYYYPLWRTLWGGRDENGHSQVLHQAILRGRLVVGAAFSPWYFPNGKQILITYHSLNAKKPRTVSTVRGFFI